jgi:hypothetical protein
MLGRADSAALSAYTLLLHLKVIGVMSLRYLLLVLIDLAGADRCASVRVSRASENSKKEPRHFTWQLMAASEYVIVRSCDVFFGFDPLPCVWWE